MLDLRLMTAAAKIAFATNHAVQLDVYPGRDGDLKAWHESANKRLAALVDRVNKTANV
jgi:hypothetical protein